MPDGDLQCAEHSGICTEIINVKEDVKDMKKSLGSIFTRVNIILGSVAGACILLAINIVIKAI